MSDVSNGVRPMSPYYQDDAVTLYHGDCQDVFAGVGQPQGCRIITDPPYGFGTYETDLAPDLNLLARWVEDNPTVAVFGYPEDLARLCARRGLEPSEWVTWWPTNTIGGQRRAKKLPRECEHIAIFGDVLGARRLFRPRSDDSFTRAKAVARGHSPEWARLGDVWRDASPGVAFNSHLRRHPNEKPESLMVRLVELCSEPGDTVFDPFCGSGTTLVAAKATGRKAVGVEIEERFCEIAAARCSQDVLEVA